MVKIDSKIVAILSPAVKLLYYERFGLQEAGQNEHLDAAIKEALEQNLLPIDALLNSVYAKVHVATLACLPEDS